LERRITGEEASISICTRILVFFLPICLSFPAYSKPDTADERRIAVKKLTFLVAVIMLAAALCASAEVRLKLATTTSTDNSGLLQVLLPPFEEMFDARVDVIAVGTGKALALGMNGDVDIVLVHARSAEDQFVKDGYGVNRRDVMYNDFIILGPADDPAGVKGMKNASAALKTISAKEVPFASRGDDSGTHKREKSLWDEIGMAPAGDWYMETGQGMGTTLQVADEKQAYTIADRGTYLAYKDKISLGILVEGDTKRLANPYGVIAVNPAKHAHANYVYAMALIGWLTSVEGQKIIGEYKRFGELLFYPTVVCSK
jgi:tungstate transport system substrate-binding protein